MRVSVIVPSRGCEYLKYLLPALRNQTMKAHELILVLKDCNIRKIEKMCESYGIPSVIIEQDKGYFTHALNQGKKAARGDILIFTDDDAIPLRRWLKKYVGMHRFYRKIAGISSRDIYVDICKRRLIRTPDDDPKVRLYRWFIRSWLERPHPAIPKKYQFGVYLTRSYDIVHGPYLPYKMCYSLPFRGVNMSFKHECMYDAWFPEHPFLKRAPGNEHYFGIQIILKGHDTIYTQNNPILHIVRESLSRTRDRARLKDEIEVMKSLIRSLLEKAR